MNIRNYVVKFSFTAQFRSKNFHNHGGESALTPFRLYSINEPPTGVLGC
jgi:hypothetical protein